MKLDLEEQNSTKENLDVPQIHPVPEDRRNRAAVNTSYSTLACRIPWGDKAKENSRWRRVVLNGVGSGGASQAASAVAQTSWE